MSRLSTALATAAILLAVAPAIAQHRDEAGHAGHADGAAHGQPYTGEDVRAVTSLSPEDVAELRRGGGWGLAKPAELNGVPGPAHLLELADEIVLSPEQVAAISALFARMRDAAAAEGERLIAAETALDAVFRGEPPTPAALERLIADAEASRARLRTVHLAAHLETPPLLTPEQIERYRVLRGYESAR